MQVLGLRSDAFGSRTRGAQSRREICSLEHAAPLSDTRRRSIAVCIRECFGVGGVEGWARHVRTGMELVRRGCPTQRPAYRGDYRGGLAQELGVEVVDEDFFDPRLREAVLAIHRDELTAYALQLRQSHGRCG